jgi:hypothetical protein
MKMRIAFALLIGALLIHPANDCTAAENSPSPCCHACGRKVCYPEVKVKKVTRQCWEIERKEICIPAIRFPWMDCNQFHHGRVRVVKVFVPKEYEIEKCDYNWKILCTHCGGAAQPCEK